MVEESPPQLTPAEESIEAETAIALEPEPESGEPMPELTSEPGFVCDCEESMRSACTGLPFYKKHERRRYCVLHYPGNEKSAEFRKAFSEKFAANDLNFCGVWFPEYVDLSNQKLDVKADFRSATFNRHADFCDTKFLRGTDFSLAVFDAGADFLEAEFHVEANLGAATFNATADFIRAKFLADANFAGAKFVQDANFPGASFVNAELGDADLGTTNFASARFTATANFMGARFISTTDFGSATFEATADFKGAVFIDALFFHVQFNALADFTGTTFIRCAHFFCTKFASKADFRHALFHKVGLFSRAVFNDGVSFFGNVEERPSEAGIRVKERALGKDPSLDFQHAELEKPERVSFHTLVLRPHWFVNCDSRQFVFTDVSWEWDRISIKQEIAALENRRVASPKRLLAIACSQLAENAEANNRYEEASRFRYWAMDLARRTKWKGWSFWKTDWLHILYWAVSGYGERIRNALWVLAAVWFLFVVLYTQVGFTKPESKPETPTVNPVIATEPDTIGQPLSLKRAWIYSLAVMSLQKPEPRPLTNWAHTLVTFETILGPVQAALLALAIRRKFMR